MRVQVEQFSNAKTVLCAVDFEPRSQAVLQRAVLLARGIGARLAVVHVVHALRSRRVIRAEANRAYVQLLAAVERASGAGTAGIDVSVRVGEPFDVIAAVADEVDAGVIVIAAPQPRAADAIVGTTAERLLRTTRRPILVVRQNVAGDYRHAVLAIDLSEATVPVVKAARELGVLGTEATTVLHALHPLYTSKLKSAGISDQQIAEHPEKWRERMVHKARELLESAGLDMARLRMLIPAERPIPAINALLERERPELLVVGASRWFLFKRLLVDSVTDEVLRSAECDVLVIPPAGALKTSRASVFARDRGRAPPAAALWQ